MPDAAIHENGPTEPRLVQAEAFEITLESLPKLGNSRCVCRGFVIQVVASPAIHLSLSRVGDLSLSESTNPSVKHVGSFNWGNLKNESFVETVFKFGPSLCKGYSPLSPYTQLQGMTASVNLATATSGLITRGLSGPRRRHSMTPHSPHKPSVS